MEERNKEFKDFEDFDSCDKLEIMLTFDLEESDFRRFVDYSVIIPLKKVWGETDKFKVEKDQVDKLVAHRDRYKLAEAKHDAYLEREKAWKNDPAVQQRLADIACKYEMQLYGECTGKTIFEIEEEVRQMQVSD